MHKAIKINVIHKLFCWKIIKFSYRFVWLKRKVCQFFLLADLITFSMISFGLKMAMWLIASAKKLTFKECSKHVQHMSDKCRTRIEHFFNFNISVRSNQSHRLSPTNVILIIQADKKLVNFPFNIDSQISHTYDFGKLKH